MLVRHLSARGSGAVLGSAQLWAHKWKRNCRESELYNHTSQNTGNRHRCCKHGSIIFWPGKTCWRSLKCAESNTMHVIVIHDLMTNCGLAMITHSEQIHFAKLSWSFIFFPPVNSCLQFKLLLILNAWTPFLHQLVLCISQSSYFYEITKWSSVL